jgi:hypothetical protein
MAASFIILAAVFALVRLFTAGTWTPDVTVLAVLTAGTWWICATIMEARDQIMALLQQHHNANHAAEEARHAIR